ncbi:hypothetical protein D3C81_1967820 [compost metagenome]
MARQASGAQVGVEFGDAGFILVDDGLDVQVGDGQRRQFDSGGDSGGFSRHGGLHQRGGEGGGQQSGGREWLVHVFSP